MIIIHIAFCGGQDRVSLEGRGPSAQGFLLMFTDLRLISVVPFPFFSSIFPFLNTGLEE